MANGRNPEKRKKGGRLDYKFVPLPVDALKSPALMSLSHTARSLLLDLCAQYTGRNNGQLLASDAYMAERGWKSHDTINRAKRELLDAGFLHETVKGRRPNKASWFALTMYPLDIHPGFDPGAADSFQRGVYKKAALPT